MTRNRTGSVSVFAVGKGDCFSQKQDRGVHEPAESLLLTPHPECAGAPGAQ